MKEAVIAVKNAAKTYIGSSRAALDSVSFTIIRGECLGIVGESGSGKSTLAKCILGIQEISDGEITLSDKPQAVLQNPSASLNPKLRIIDSLLEPLDAQKHLLPSFLADVCHDRRKTGDKLLSMVSLPGGCLDQYPHQLSGGQKQRVSIARAISVEPRLIVFDEPTASLDVLVQAKVLNLLKDLQEKLGLSYLFISHDLAAVNFMSQRIGVMKDGQLLDLFRREALFSPQRHPYTKQLIEVFDS
ncbi:ABC transporter ATP-binding protein [Fictibacillus aquaticus]|uniref:Peptide ABC transporter ATP-binding protein n=1 Tax=Fictibacillus aquaticus TaxID=2021314 RepID=A0A235FD87_9BACL|nr:ATP-binding cassette domain-containing protein [Fictibacillus aquaticus]OYD59306.1 peptide ABC transporter ATP-binding protein [Fictibacillus aquaticus]